MNTNIGTRDLYTLIENGDEYDFYNHVNGESHLYLNKEEADELVKQFDTNKGKTLEDIE